MRIIDIGDINFEENAACVILAVGAELDALFFRFGTPLGQRPVEHAEEMPNGDLKVCFKLPEGLKQGDLDHLVLVIPKAEWSLRV